MSARRAATLTAAVGIAHAVLFLLAFWLLESTPAGRATDAEITEFYATDARRRLTIVGLYIMPFAGIAFVWFSVLLRMWISHSTRRENILLSNIQLVSGILYVALFSAAAATSSATAAGVEFAGASVEPSVARQLPLYGSTLLLVFAMRMAAMFVMTTSNIGRISGVLPGWFSVLGFAVGLFLLLSATLSAALVLAFPTWLLILCVLLLRRALRIPADLSVA
jgi:hypothetical protein